ncbi:hypothetical protein BDV97DRAFT_369280 [Delphinella strobiligena]|nr:hypothetical protein BDV97DRAFT_369280 [Delphinella strobiligena]
METAANEKYLVELGHPAGSECMHCQNCSRRADWDFLRDFFHREQSLTHYTQTVEAQLAAVRLTLCSTRAHYTALQQSYQICQETCETLQARLSDDERCNHDLLVESAITKDLYETSKTHILVLEQQNQNTQNALEYTSNRLDSTEKELQAAIETAQLFGDMLNRLTSTDVAIDGGEDTHSSLDVVEVMLQSTHRHLEERAQSQPLSGTSVTQDEVEDTSSPSSARLQWESYRAEQPFRADSVVSVSSM